jgi:tyrosine-protein phosphatase SIW14
MISRNLSGCRRTLALLLLLGLPVLAADAPSGLNNFQQINDHLYRGAQPSDEGFRSLAKLGVKTILDLRERAGGSRSEARLVESLGMHYVNVPMNGFSAPTREQVSRVLALFDDASVGPVFVHCRRGADRTGTMIAIYRIGHDHWDNWRALAEAKAFKMAGWEHLMQSFIMHYQSGAEPASAPAQPAASMPAVAAR